MGIAEEFKGRVKQAIGDVTDKPELRTEGKAQADKGAEDRKARQARAEAKGHEAKADLHDRKQEAAERA